MRSPRWCRETWRRPRNRGTAPTRARFGPIGGKTSGKRPCEPLSLGSIACMRLQGRRQQAEQPHPFGPVEEADPLQQPRRRQRELDPAGVRKQVMENQTLRASWSSRLPSPSSASAILNGSIILPY